jgi:secondary thiamine-phosphate synthase enzyme
VFARFDTMGTHLEDRTVTRKACKEPTTEPVVLATNEQPPIRTEALHLSTSESNEFWDVTAVVRDVAKRSGVRHGQVTVCSPHTTCSIVVNESETGFLNDYRRAIERIVPVDAYYEHDDHDVRTENLQEDEFLNGHSHVRHLLVGQPSVTLPVVDGEVLLGQWQRVIFVELDQGRDRRVFIHAQGA